jgi:hypothetical protein
LKNFLLLNSLQKKFENFLQSISLKKNFENFSENPKKNCLPKKKKRSQGGRNVPFFPVKSDTTFHWVLRFILNCQKNFKEQNAKFRLELSFWQHNFDKPKIELKKNLKMPQIGKNEPKHWGEGVHNVLACGRLWHYYVTISVMSFYKFK